MINLTPTTCKVNDFFIRESLVTAERHHALTRNDAVGEAKPIPHLVIRWPRLSLFRRLGHLLPRPA